MSSLAEFDAAQEDVDQVFDLSEIIKFKQTLAQIKKYPAYNLILNTTQRVKTGYYKELLGMMSVTNINQEVVDKIIKAQKKSRNGSLSPTKKRKSIIVPTLV